MKKFLAGTLCVMMALAAPAFATAAKPPVPKRFLVDRVHPDGFTLGWRDGSGERRYELAQRPTGESGWTIARLPGDSRSARTREIEKGTVVEHRLRACDRRRCSDWTPVRAQATALHRHAGRFPDPYPDVEAGCDVFPEPPVLPPGSASAADHSAWNQDISTAPLHPQSAAIIAQILADGGRELHPDFGSNPDYGIPYVVVPGAQPLVRVRIGRNGYPDESDFGDAPVPPRSRRERGSDHHVLVVNRDRCELWEMYRARYLGGVRNRWQADSTAFFDLGAAGPLRPEGHTSADAAGLPVFAGLVRYEEVAVDALDHAIRVTFERTRRAYIHPATHYASDSCAANRPPMGLRLRLRTTYPTAGLAPQARVIAEALQRYGMLAADNGSNFFISGTTDSRWDDGELNDLKTIDATDFEVVQSAAAPVTSC